MIEFLVNSLFHDFLLQITFLSPETRTHKLQFSKHDKPFLYHPTHRHILARRIFPPKKREEPRERGWAQPS
jgi:hypothetical protein